MNERRPAPAINDAGRMSQQVLDRDLALRRYGFGRRFSVGVARRHPYAGEAFEGIGNRLVHQEPPLLVQHQRAYGGHRLRHRCDVENRIGGHRHAGFLVAPAIGFEKHNLPAPGDCDDGAGYTAAFDVGVKRSPDPREPLGRYANFLRLGARQRQFVRHCGSSGQCRRYNGDCRQRAAQVSPKSFYSHDSPPKN